MKYTDEYGNEYDSYQAARDAGVDNPIPINTAAATGTATGSAASANTANAAAASTVANIPTYGYELQKLMRQYGVNAPVAPRTTDQNLINQYFNKLQAPMYQTPFGNGLFDKYLNIGLGKIASPFGDMTRFFPGQAVCGEGERFDPVTARCVNVTDPAGAASGRITTGTPNIGGNQCPPNFNFDPVSRSCIPTIDTGLLTGGESQSGKQPMPNCPPNTTLDTVNRICIPKGCPAGYEQDASGNCVAKSTPIYCPPGFTRDANGVCIPPSVPECPPNTVKNQATGQCVPTSCPAGYEMDASGRCVAESMQVPCPPGFNRDATGVCLPIIRQEPCPDGKPRDYLGNCASSTEQPCPSGSVRSATGQCVPVAVTPPPPPTPCQSGYVRSATGQCVPDPEQLAFFNKHYQSPQAGEYDIYNAITKGNLSENLVRDLVSQRGGENVDQWLAQNVDPDKTFSAYAIQNLAAQGDVDDPNVANRGSQSGANRVFDLYKQGAMGLGEIEEAMGKQGVQDWMKTNQPAEYNRVYGSQQPATNVQPANAVFDTVAEQQNMAVYNQAKSSGMNAQQVSAQYGIPESEISDWMALRGLKLAGGGSVSKYAKGGSVDFDNIMRKYQVGGLNTFNSMLGQAPAARPAMIGQPPMREEGLDQMVQRYNVGRSSNSRQDYDQASERLKQAMMSASEASPVAAGPSKAEMYFRLASAFAQPTPTGNFFESLGNAGGELAAIGSERRADASANAAMKRDLAIELAKADVTRARDIMEMESESGRPLSASGRTASDEGLVMGTPEFAKRVQQLSAEEAARRVQAAPTRMSATEARAKLESESQITSSEIAINSLEEALALSSIAYTKSVSDTAAYALAKVRTPDSQRVVATRQMEQLMTTNVLNSLKLMFGGNPTEGERAIAMATQGLDAISVEERNGILGTLLSIAEERLSSAMSRLERINAGQYMQYDDVPTAELIELTAGQETGAI